MRATLLVLLVITSGCATTAPLRMTSAGAGASALHHRVETGPLPSYASVVVRGTECHQRFGDGPRYDEHPVCKLGMTAPIFTLSIPEAFDVPR